MGCFSCATSTEEQKKAEVQQEASATYDSFGAEIDDKGAMPLVQFASEFNSDSASVKLSGVATAVCKKKGCWMNIAVDGDETMKVTFKDYGFFVPKDIEGKNVIFEGVATRQVTDVATLKHYAEDAGKSKEEIDAITEPKEELVFEATGILNPPVPCTPLFALKPPPYPPLLPPYPWFPP